jgi:hypothetical protein
MYRLGAGGSENDRGENDLEKKRRKRKSSGVAATV